MKPRAFLVPAFVLTVAVSVMPGQVLGGGSSPCGCIQVSAGSDHTCAVRANGSVACWGLNDYRQAAPPAGTGFTQVSAGSHHTCALKGDGSIVCWGDTSKRQAIPLAWPPLYLPTVRKGGV